MTYLEMKYLITLVALLPSLAFGQEKDDSIVGRPYESFESIAFCSYNNFHPSQYLTDNNWDILCAFVDPGSKAKLDSLGIPSTKSQLRLLEVGDLLSVNNGEYRTKMKIFGKSETDEIRRQSKEFAGKIFPEIEPDIVQLISDFNKAGYSKQTYSLIFSYLLDSYIWDDRRLPSPMSCEDHGTWSGAYWAMYDKRDHETVGTNGFGPVHQNWTNNLGYWMRSKDLFSFAKEVNKSNGSKIENQEVINSVASWGLTDEEGNILIPVLHANNNDDIDILCQRITNKLSSAIKDYCTAWSSSHGISNPRLGQIIFYHEVMWDLLDILESKNMITMPAILKGQEVGKEHFGDICFIVIDDNETE